MAKLLLQPRTVLVTALVYVLTSASILWPMSSSTPLWQPAPAAGIALAAVLIFGRAALAGVLIGSVLTQAIVAMSRGLGPLDAACLAGLIGFGATLQAWVGMKLIQRFCLRPLVLDKVRDIVLAGTVGVTVASIEASAATVAATLVGRISAQEWPPHLIGWWLSGAMGVIIGAPAALAFIGRPRIDWRARKLTVALPLLVCAGLFVAAMHELQRLDTERLQAQFERDADRLAAFTELRLSMPLYALKALQSAAHNSGTPNDASLQDASQWWLQQSPHLIALGHSAHVMLADIPRFEKAEREQGPPEFRVYDLRNPSVRFTDGEVIVVRRIFLLQPGRARAVLGMNVLSIPEAREAVMAARQSGEVRASAGFRLTQSDNDETGMVLYQSLYEGQPETDAERKRSFRGVVFVTVNLALALGKLTLVGEEHLRWCLSDADSKAARQVLASSADVGACNPKQFDHYVLHIERSISMGGRDLVLRIAASVEAMPGSHPESYWLRPLGGVIGLALLGALLLTVTGMTRRTQRAIEVATADLRHEMSERALAESALRDSEMRLRSILNNVPLGVSFLDTEGKVLDGNPSMCQMANRALDEMRGRPITELLHVDDAPKIIEQRRALVSGRGVVTTSPMRMLSPNGGEVLVRMRATALRDPDGHLQRIVAVIEDLSEEMRLLASQRALNLAELASRAKSDLLSGLSHDLRTPLNAIVGFAQLLNLDSESSHDPRRSEWTRQILSASWHLLEMIEQTLDLTRIETGCVQLTIVPVEVASLVAACRSMVDGRAAQQGIRLDEHLEPDAPRVLADAVRIKQVLTNLLSNAIKYNRSGGKVTITVSRRGNHMVDIAVADTGLGMTPEQLQALFQRYNRLGRETSGIEGTGLGLVISRELTELMGGTLEVESRAGEGSTFTICLPCARSQVEEQAVEPR